MPLSVTRRTRRFAGARVGRVPIPLAPISSEIVRSPNVLDPSTGGQVQPAPTPAVEAIPAGQAQQQAGSSVGGGGLSGFGPTPGTYRLSPTDPDAARMIGKPGYQMTSAADAAPHLAQLAAEGNPTTAAGVDAQRLNDPYFAALRNAENRGLIARAPVVKATATPTSDMDSTPLVR